jgi:hypothetical protein
MPVNEAHGAGKASNGICETFLKSPLFLLLTAMSDQSVNVALDNLPNMGMLFMLTIPITWIHYLVLALPRKLIGRQQCYTMVRPGRVRSERPSDVSIVHCDHGSGTSI